jgi:pyridoxine/pyridoxamine 5'-phosphate oxidase
MNWRCAEPNAFTLATVSENGTPEARVMLLERVWTMEDLYFIPTTKAIKQKIWLTFR